MMSSENNNPRDEKTNFEILMQTVQACRADVRHAERRLTSRIMEGRMEVAGLQERVGTVEKEVARTSTRLKMWGAGLAALFAGAIAFLKDMVK